VTKSRNWPFSPSASYSRAIAGSIIYCPSSPKRWRTYAKPPANSASELGVPQAEHTSNIVFSVKPYSLTYPSAEASKYRDMRFYRQHSFFHRLIDKRFIQIVFFNMQVHLRVKHATLIRSPLCWFSFFLLSL
jgi:hypothetical protein